MPIIIGGLFYENTAEYYAFLKAIDDVNNNPMLLDGYHLEPMVEFHKSNWIVEAASVLSRNPTAVIAPPTSQAVKKISPLFSLATTPLIGYSATASILSDTDIFPYFYRVSPDVSNLVGPIIGLFQVCFNCIWIVFGLYPGTPTTKPQSHFNNNNNHTENITIKSFLNGRRL